MLTMPLSVDTLVYERGRVSYLLIKEKAVIVEPEGGTDDGRGSRKVSTLSE